MLPWALGICSICRSRTETGKRCLNGQVYSSMIGIAAFMMELLRLRFYSLTYVYKACVLQACRVPIYLHFSQNLHKFGKAKLSKIVMTKVVKSYEANNYRF